MKFLKAALTFLLSLTLVFTTMTSARAAAVEFMVLENNPGVGLGENAAVSYVQAVAMPSVQNPTPTQKLCTTFDDAICSKSQSVEIYALLPVCSETSARQCISKLTIYEGTSKFDAKFLRYTGKTVFPENLSAKIPEGSAISLWERENSSGGKSYYVAKVMLKVNKFGSSAGVAQQMNAQVFKVELKSGTGKEQGYVADFTWPNGATSVNGYGEMMGDCLFVQDGICGEAILMKDEGAELTFKIDKTLSGWLHGRITEPVIAVTPVDDWVNEIKVFGKSVNIPITKKKVERSQLDADMQNTGAGAGGIPDGDIGISNLSYQFGAYEQFLSWQKYLGDKATDEVSAWSIRSVTSGFNPCLRDTTKLIGLVTTNATAYENSAPRFENDSLNYKVAALHYKSDGSEFKGTYDLVMRSEVARCLYRFTSAPVRAEISITSSEGDKNVATTLLTEKDGWLRLGAYGFTFSNPIVKVKLTQEKVVEAPKTVTPTPSTNTAAKKVSITCVKGKTTKKVNTGKCPAGYKKK